MLNFNLLNGLFAKFIANNLFFLFLLMSTHGLFAKNKFIVSTAFGQNYIYFSEIESDHNSMFNTSHMWVYDINAGYQINTEKRFIEFTVGRRNKKNGLSFNLKDMPSYSFHGQASKIFECYYVGFNYGFHFLKNKNTIKYLNPYIGLNLSYEIHDAYTFTNNGFTIPNDGTKAEMAGGMDNSGIDHPPHIAKDQIGINIRFGNKITLKKHIALFIEFNTDVIPMRYTTSWHPKLVNYTANTVTTFNATLTKGTMCFVMGGLCFSF